MKWRVAVAAAGAAGSLAVAGLGIAQGAWPTVTKADLEICRPIYAQAHASEQGYIQLQINDYCQRGSQYYDQSNCQFMNEWMAETRAMDSLDWYYKGNGRCEGSDYPCFGPEIHNTARSGEDATYWIGVFEDHAADTTRITQGMEFWQAANVADNCTARAWVQKYRGAAPASRQPAQAAAPPVLSGGGGKSSGGAAAAPPVLSGGGGKAGGGAAAPPALSGGGGKAGGGAAVAPPALVGGGGKSSGGAPQGQASQLAQAKPAAPAPSQPAAPVQHAIIKFAPDAARGQIAPLDGAGIAACEESMHVVQADAQGWKGTPDETALRTGLLQRTLYAGRCAGHPEAFDRVVEAERTIAAKAALAAATFTDARDTTPDVIDCVEPMAPGNSRNPTGSPALVNVCNFPVYVAYCNVSPAKGSWAEMFACGVGGSLGMDVILPYDATPAVFGREIQHFACRQPAGPVLTYVAGVGLDGFCK
jgi:hypothetical protein